MLAVLATHAAVLAMLSLSCGCTEALVEDHRRLVYCSTDHRGGWWCECVDLEDPQECEHVLSLLLLAEAGGS